MNIDMDIQQVSGSTEQKQPVAPSSNPFPGLRPFRMEESHLFFGRSNQVNEVLTKLAGNRFVAIVGKSGIGKSSFVNCGILPKLQKGEPVTDACWHVVSFRPGGSPLKGLQRAFEKVFSPKRHDAGASDNASFVDPVCLCKWALEYYHNTGRKILIYIDQFEEIFRFNVADEDKKSEISQFIDLLINIVQASVPISFILTIRSDFVGDCSRFPEFTKAINNSQFLIPQMTKVEKSEAITGPIKVMGAHISEALVERILDEIDDRPDQLPLMQHALMRTWDYWQSVKMGDEVISLLHYERIGTLSKALSVHANEIFNELDQEKKKICERLFKSITEKGAEGRSVRRPASIREISVISGAHVDTVTQIVEHFRKPGRTILTPSSDVPLTDQSVIDVSHESLMWIWEVLAGWLEEEHEAIKEYLHISEAAAMHQSGKGGLMKPPELQMALNWKAENKPTKDWGIRHDKAYDRAMQFLAFSEKKFLQEQRLKEKLQKLRLAVFKIIAIVFGAGAIVALGFFFYAQKQREEAIKQQQLATEQQQIAKEEAENAQRSAKEALKQKKIADKQKQSALLNQKIANEQKQQAMEQREIAESERQFAMEQKDKATMAQQKAQKLRLLSIARSMAVKSLQESNPLIKSLSARQAYNLFNDNGGGQMDPDIYNALYYAVKTLKGDDYNKAKAHTDNVRSILAARNTSCLYSAGSDGQVFRWKREGTGFAATLLDKDPGKVHKSMDLSKDSKKLITGGNYGYIKQIDLNTLAIRKVEIPYSNVLFVSFMPTGKQFVYLTNTNKIVQCNFTKSEEIIGFDKKVNTIDMHPNGAFLAVGIAGGHVKIVDLESGQTVDLFNAESGADITSVKYSEDGRMLAVGDMKGMVHLLEPSTGRELYSLSGHTAMVNEISFSHSGMKLATASFDHSVRIWSLDRPYDQPVILNDHDDWVWSVEFDQSDKYLLAGCRDKLIRSWLLDLEAMATVICQDSNVTRNFTKTEWDNYVAEDVEYESTCTCHQMNQEQVSNQTTSVQ